MLDTARIKKLFVPSSLDFDTASQLYNNLSAIVEKVDNQSGDKTNRVEKDLVRFLIVQYRRHSTKAIRDALRTIPRRQQKFTEDDSKKFLDTLDAGMLNVEQRGSERILRDLTRIYKYEKVRFANDFDARIIRKQEDDSSNFPTSLAIGVSFDLVDQNTAEQLSDLVDVAIGDHYPKTLKPIIIKALNEAVYELGLNQEQAGVFLREALTKQFGTTGFAVPASIVAQGQRAIANYFEGLVATNVTLAMNFAAIQQSDQAGITRLEFMAVIDDRTSEICRSMHGRIFTIDQAKIFRERVLKAETVSDLKVIAPWQRSLKQFGLGPGIKLKDKATSELLASQGIVVPPLHFKCRSRLVPA